MLPTEPMRVVTCPKCYVQQDGDKPVCVHLTGLIGGRATILKYGRAHFKRMAKLSPRTKKQPRKAKVIWP